MITLIIIIIIIDNNDEMMMINLSLIMINVTLVYLAEFYNRPASLSPTVVPTYSPTRARTLGT